MTVQLRPYRADPDFLRVRDFLARTYLAFGAPLNWGIERWNWARYHPSIFGEGEKERIRLWESAIGLWEDESGQIVGLAHVESARLGEAFIQRHPRHPELLEPMLAYAEERLADAATGALQLYLYDEDPILPELAARRGFQQDAAHPGYDSEYAIGAVPPSSLPEGYWVRSMADENDLVSRCRVQGLGFDHPDPSEWATPYDWSQVQTAPDYRPELDLVLVAPDGELVSSCIVWYDAHNRLGLFEPVSTHMGYRRRGFGREVVLEGIRRVAALGGTRARVGSGQPFYAAIGFERKWVSHPWNKGA